MRIKGDKVCVQFDEFGNIGSTVIVRVPDHPNQIIVDMTENVDAHTRRVNIHTLQLEDIPRPDTPNQPDKK